MQSKSIKLLSEDQLCRLFAEAVLNSTEFRTWVIGCTKFGSHRENVRLLVEEQQWRRPNVAPANWWRHWWVPGSPEVEERETDIFLVFEIANSGDRFALHIENKEKSKFSTGQAEAYEGRARFMMKKDRYLHYNDYETVLIAPQAFRACFRDKCDSFGCFISYEQIANYVTQFAR